MNPISWPVDDRAVVRTLTLDDTEVVFRAVDQNRDRLRPYMPWERTTLSPRDVRAFIERSLASPTDLDANGIWVGEEFAGTVGLRVDTEMNSGEIGYWIVGAFEGQGLVTKVCRLLLDHGFREQKLHRIEIHAAADNLRSRAVAERLGFTHEATTRDGHRKYDDVYVDQVVYGMLEHEWPAT
ncbi:MAG: GNAT family N-acetyltransferase [Actinomycetota bacterium]